MKNKIVQVLISSALLTSTLIFNCNKTIAASNLPQNQNIKIKAKEDSLFTKRLKYMKKINEIKKAEEERRIKEEEELRAAQAAQKKYIEMNVPQHSSFKSYMGYHKITNHNSQQWALQQTAYSDENGLRKIDDYYLVAMGQYYGTVGDKFKVTLSSGQQFNVIMGDMKKYEHTFNGEGQIGADNKDMFEFIVDYSNLNSNIKRDGSVNCIFNGTVLKLEKEG